MTLTNSLHMAEEEKEKVGGWGCRFRGDLDDFRFSSFKSQHCRRNLMLDDLVEICRMGRAERERERERKKNAAKTISCCFHYLMHHLQSGKWTSDADDDEGERSHIEQAADRTPENKRLKWEEVGVLVFFSGFAIKKKHSSVHTAP